MTKSEDEISKEIPRLMGMPGSLVFTAEGRWLHAGVEITHEKIRDYFSRHLRYSEPHSGYVIEVDGKCVLVEVEDTPQVVRTIDTTTRPWKVYLSGDLQEHFDPQELSVTEAGIFYLLVKDSDARLLRPAVQSLMPYLDELDGSYVLQIDQQNFRVQIKN